MYKCHLCELHTKQLNGLMSRHYKTHCNKEYSKDQYKTDALTYNGRQQKICTVCNLPTSIPRGEADYPAYHRECYVNNLKRKTGDSNLNWKGGLEEFECSYCGKTRRSYSSQIGQNNVFCSISCSAQFYNVPENQSDAKKKAIEFQKDVLRKLVKTETFKAKRVAALLKMGATSTSKIEQDFHKRIQSVYPDAVNGYQLDFYSVDIWIPSQNIAIDVQGNYWHNNVKTRSRDKQKACFFANNRPDINFYTIWESELNDNFYSYEKPYELVILCGPSGSGKTWIGEQLKDKYEIIDYDKIRKIDDIIDISKTNTNNTKLIITPIRATWLARELRKAGLRVKVVGLIEDEDVIESRLMLRGSNITNGVKNRIKRYNNIKDKICMFWGTQSEVLEYLNAFKQKHDTISQSYISNLK